jgi:hypothetical protein
MGRFDRISEALRYTVYALANRKHAYIINVRGPREIRRNEAAAFQIVPATYLYDDGNLDPTLHLTFDPDSGDLSRLLRFQRMPGNEQFDEMNADGIPTFALRLGYNINVAKRWIEHVLTHVMNYPEGTDIECEVYDEGRMK